MAFRFNWSSMDDSVAEMVRLLINDRLEALVAERFSSSSLGPLPLPSTTATLSSGPVSTGTSGTLASGAMRASGGSEMLPTLGAANGLGALGSLGTTPGARNNNTDDATAAAFPFSQGGGLAGVNGASATSGPALYGAPAGMNANNAGLAGGTAANIMAAHAGSGGGGGGSVPAAVPSSLFLSATPTQPPGPGSLTAGPALAMGNGGGASVVGSTTGAHAALSRPPVPNSTNTNRSTTAGIAPRLPPIRELYVDGLEWGVVAPFIEVVNFEDAMHFDACEHEPREAAAPQGAAGPCDSPRKYPSTNSVRPSSSATTATELEEVPALVLPGSRASAASGPSAGPEGPSYAAQRRGSCPLDGGAGSPLPQTGAGAAETGESAVAVDALAPFLGAKGLFVRLHVTYGGAMSFSVKTVVQHELAVGPISLPISMPLEIRAGDVDLDCFVCLNLIDNECRFWLEPGKLSVSPLNRLNLTVVFGTRGSRGNSLSRGGEGADSLVDSDIFSDDRGGMQEDVYDDYQSTSSEDMDDDDESVYVDESAISQFVLRELKAILQEKLVAPHYVRIPLH